MRKIVLALFLVIAVAAAVVVVGVRGQQPGSADRAGSGPAAEQAAAASAGDAPAGPASAVPAPAPSPARPAELDPTPAGLERGDCGPSQGRMAWWQGDIQCHKLDNGHVVALGPGPELDLSAYTGDPVQRQLAYIHDYWDTTGPAGYTYIPDNDCADFVSWSLAVRGWDQTDAWSNPGGWDMSPAWVSSTAFRSYALTRAGVTEVTDTGSAREKVQVGDVVQFDWDLSGDRDHTAVVSKVVHEGGTSKIYVAEHSDPALYRDVDVMLDHVHPGSKAYFLLIR